METTVTDATVLEVSLGLAPLLESIRPQMAQVTQLLDETASRVEGPLRSMLQCSLGGGKRLRPALAILIGQAYSAPAAPFCSLGAAVEMLHAATLIHDDLVDGSPRRRGHATLHTVWPTAAAVLAGDYLLGEATCAIARLGHPSILEVFAKTLRAMCTDEIRRLVTTEGTHVSRSDYYRSIEAKTSSLLSATTEMAGILAGANALQVCALQRFGRELGLAFQIVDDVLDYCGDETQLGKPVGSDLRQGCVTLPALYYLEEAEDDTPLRIALRNGVSGDSTNDQVRAAVAAVCASGAIEASLAEARLYARQSREALTVLPDSPHRRTLCALTDYVVERAR